MATFHWIIFDFTVTWKQVNIKDKNYDEIFGILNSGDMVLC